ncbi:MAG: hypothetical protein HZB55_17115 [Deltaproteobacteria bacterium]|nr:hypothetical protein [Deltaproteobacteria bacterium]
MKRIALTLSSLSLVAFLCACAGTPLKIPNQPDSSKYEVLGEAEGSCTGIMLFNIIPIRQNDRFVCAYDEAVHSKGGDALINFQVQDNWFWAYVLNGYKATVSGTVIKYRN